MNQVTFKGSKIEIFGHLPEIHVKAPAFCLTDKELHPKTLETFKGKKKVICSVPSLDTGVCSTMTKHINELAKKNDEVVFIIVSKDLPFAQKRFCEAENVHNIIVLSMMKDNEFGKHYGILISSGPLEGLLARAVFILDEKDHLLYKELVAEITQEPDYQKIQKVLKGQ